jgi:hypothetical protein
VAELGPVEVEVRVSGVDELAEKVALERKIVRLAIALERARAVSKETYNVAEAELTALDETVRSYNALAVKMMLPE